MGRLRVWILVLALLGPAPARATPASALFDAIGWHSPSTPRLLDDPLAVLGRPPGAALAAEWAPLYRGADGERLESEFQFAHAHARRGSWNAAVEVGSNRMEARGGDGPLQAETWRPAERHLTAGLMRTGRRHRWALVSGLGSGAPDVGLGAGLELAPGWRAEAGALLESHRGGLVVNYDGSVADGRGAWTERRLNWRLDGDIGPASVGLGIESLDRVPTTAEDGYANPLAWRAHRFTAAVPAGGVDWAIELEHGAGRERFELLRGGVAYARIVTPLATSRVALGMRTPESPIGARFWTGRWRGEPDGHVGLWAFDGLAALAGSRGVMRSRASVTHAGVAVEVSPRRAPVELGLAAWWLRPEATYQSWLAPLMAVGREDYREGRLDVRSLWLAGVRLAAGAERFGVRWRVEAIQWVPVAIRRAPSAPAADSGGGAGSARVESPPGSRSWGGTVLRLEIATR